VPEAPDVALHRHLRHLPGEGAEVSFYIPDPTETGCWLAYYADWSGMVVFQTEVECLRHAVKRGMSVKLVEWGTDLRTGEPVDG
jgi:hypothetical protein